MPAMTACLVGEGLRGPLAISSKDENAWTLIEDFEAKAPSGLRVWCR